MQIFLMKKIFFSCFFFSIIIFFSNCTSQIRKNSFSDIQIITPIIPIHTRSIFTQSPKTITKPALSTLSYNIINRYPHDPNAFTQGLAYSNGYLYESTGYYGQSTLRKVNLHTGDVIQLQSISEQYFGEGLTLLHDQIVLLTWQSKIGLIFNKNTFQLIDDFPLSGEGWGLTFDGTNLIYSDGTSFLHFIDPISFHENSKIEVLSEFGPVTNLNELEFVNGDIYANIWHSSRIIRINPQNGQVIDWIELEGLLEDMHTDQHIDVLNGIAYDSINDRLFVTGKLWPILYEIKIVPIQ